MAIHNLKTWTELYRAVSDSDPLNRKTLDIRRDDRNFDVGDLLILEEFDPETQTYSGKCCRVMVTHCLRGLPWVPEGYVAMSILLREVMNEVEVMSNGHKHDVYEQ